VPTEVPTYLQEMIEDLHALCERGLRCHFLSDSSAMCVTCRAAHTLYHQHRLIADNERTPA